MEGYEMESLKLCLGEIVLNDYLSGSLSDERKIEVEKQDARDTASIATAISKENELVFNEINNINRTVFSDVKEIQASRERLSSSISDFRGFAVQGMSDDAAEIYTNRSKLTETSRLRQYENALFRKEIDLGRSQASLSFGKNYEILLSDNTDADQKASAIESIEITRAGFERYFDSGELSLLEEKTKISVFKNLGKFEEAKELASTTKAFTPQDREATLNSIDRAMRASKTRNEKLFDESAAKVEPNWLQRLRAGDPTLEDDVEDWVYGGNDPEMLRKQVDLKEEWLKKLDSKVLTDKTSDIYTAWVAKVDLSPTTPVGKKTLREAIYAQVGPDRTKDLSIKEAEHLVTKLEGNLSNINTRSNSLHSRYQKLLTGQFNSRLFGKPKKTGSARRTYNEISLQLTQFANENPTATDKEWKEMFASSIEKDKKPFFLIRALQGASPLFGIVTKFQERRDDTIKDIPESAPEITSFKVGDTQPTADGTVYIMIKKGPTPAEDVWQRTQ